MVSLKAHFDGKVIVPDEPVDLAPNQKLRITIEAVEPAASSPANRIPGRQREPRSFGQPGVVVYVAPDFDDHLGDDFWGLDGDDVRTDDNRDDK